jgi:hypothetical protein
MSQENVERFWRGTTAYNDGDWDAALATMDPNVEFDLSRVMPEMEMYRGYEGVRPSGGCSATCGRLSDQS